MTKDQFKSFFKYISSVSKDTNPSPEKTQVYYDALCDIPFDLAMMAARKVISTLEDPFLPMPAVFRRAAQEIVNPQTMMTAAEAWEEARKAVRKFGYYKEEEGLSSLSPPTRRVMESIGWKNFCTDENEGVLRGRFSQFFETTHARDNEEERLPQKLKEMIGNVGVLPGMPESGIQNHKAIRGNVPDGD